MTSDSLSDPRLGLALAVLRDRSPYRASSRVRIHSGSTRSAVKTIDARENPARCKPSFHRPATTLETLRRVGPGGLEALLEDPALPPRNSRDRRRRAFF